MMPDTNKASSFIIENIEAPIEGAVVTVGMFDGVHRGHRALFETMNRVANGDPKVAITFDHHPMSVLSPAKTPPLLTTADEKSELLKSLGVDHVLTLRSSPELFSLSADAFIETFLCGIIKAKHLIIGPDFALGRHRTGEAEFLARAGQRHGFALTVVPPTRVGAEVVSSTRIRKLLAAAGIEAVTECLGRPYSVTGTVVVGKQLGRTLGFPTANLDVPPEKALPADGIYAGAATVDGRVYKAAISVGLRPTVNGNGRTVEAYLLDFNGDLYGMRLRYEFLRWLRAEEKYPSLAALAEQIARDVEETRRTDLPSA